MMKTSKLWLYGLVVCACLVHSSAAHAQFRRGAARVIRRYPHLELQQAKQAAAMQKNYLEWNLNTQAEAAKQRAAHIAELQRKKAEAEVQREARVEKIKERNEELAARQKEKTNPDKASGNAPSGDATSDDASDKSEVIKQVPEAGANKTPEKEPTTRNDKPSTSPGKK